MNADTFTPSPSVENPSEAKKGSGSMPGFTMLPPRRPLTTKNAIEYLLAGTLRSKVCRYCLCVSQHLTELDEIISIADSGGLYKVTIRTMVAAFHPFQVSEDPNLPNKICGKCLDQTIKCYLFTQRCEQSERALRNCYNDMFDKVGRLDRLNRGKKQKLHVNYNILYTEHTNVIDYAEPIRHLINSGSTMYTNETAMADLECKKCWQVLPDQTSLVAHEKLHPKSMWFNCRLCGHSYAQIRLFKKHLNSHSNKNNKIITLPESDNFECKQCGQKNDNHLAHLQHIEKHKFKMVLEHLIEKKMDKLCVVCLDQGKLTDLDKVISLHGGYPELCGDRSLYNIVGSSISEMNILLNYTGKKICEKCLDKSIISYVFINRTRYIRNRLNTCITQMLEKLEKIEPENTLLIEIANNGIMPILDNDDNIDELLIEDSDVDETKLKVDVLEDEFRIESDSEESDNEIETKSDKNKVNLAPKNITKSCKQIRKRESILINGYQSHSTNKVKDVCSEFLTFKTKVRNPKITHKCKYTCPSCNKHFISDYFLARHAVKHAKKKVKCKLCLVQFESKFDLQEHVKISHRLNKSVYNSCKTCGRLFTDGLKLLRHEKCHLRKECQLCSKIFKCQKSYDNHIRRHGNQLNILKQKAIQHCAFCSKEISNDNEMSTHVNKVHLQLKPYSCDMCERQFYTEEDMRRHKKLHSLKCKQKCEFCSKTLNCRRDLVIHVRKHIGIKPFKCNICTQSFFSESKMKSHMRKWHGGCYCCRLCKKVFVSKKGLKNHANRAHSVF